MEDLMESLIEDLMEDVTGQMWEMQEESLWVIHFGKGLETLMGHHL